MLVGGFCEPRRCEQLSYSSPRPSGEGLMAEDAILTLREEVSTLQAMLLEAVAELRKVMPTAAAAFKKKHQGFSVKLNERSMSRTNGKAAGSCAAIPSPSVVKEEEWKPVKAEPKRAAMTPGPTSVAATDKDILMEAGWSKPILTTLDAVRPTAEGVYLATATEAKQLLAEVRAQGALAVLSPIQVGDECKGSWIAALVTDKKVRQQVRQRWLSQLGSVPMEYVLEAT